MHFKDMKWYMKILMGFLVLLLSPFLLLAILLGVAFALITPLVEIPYYRQTAYRRIFGERYSFLITQTPRFRAVKLLRRHRPDAAFPPAGNDRFHCFTVGKTLVFFGICDRFVYDTETGKWLAATAESDEPRDLDAVLAEYPHRPDPEWYPVARVKILASAKLFYEENGYRALEDDRFIVYTGRRDLKKKLLHMEVPK